jgi:hypothetical protein
VDLNIKRSYSDQPIHLRDIYQDLPELKEINMLKTLKDDKEDED